MSILRLAFELFVLYLIYKFIFDLIIPLTQTTKKVKKQFGEMHDRMEEQQRQYEKERSYQSHKPTPKAPSSDDYIEFEEVK